MAKQNQAAETKSDKKSQPRVESTVVEELTDDVADLARLPGGPIAAAGDGTIQAQAARLDDRRLQGAQRRALAARIGRAQGNRHLQRVVTALKPDEQEEPGSLSGTLEPIEGQPLPREAQLPGRADTAFGRTAPSQVQGASPALERLRVNAQLTFASAVENIWQGSGLVRGDAVNSSLSFGSSVSGGHTPPPNSFGEEVPTVSVDHISCTRAGGLALVRARIFVACRWGVQSLGNTNVSGGSDPAVTSNTWKKIVADLTPDARGEPWRKAYWARDITARHEQFHANDDIGRAQRYVPTAQTWLNRQTISVPTMAEATRTFAPFTTLTVGRPIRGATPPSVDAEVRRLLDTVRENVESDINTHYQSRGEDRAYADGRSLYNQRVADVRARATKEGWK